VIHGGAFVSGSMYSHPKLFGHLAKAAGVRALHVTFLCHFSELPCGAGRPGVLLGVTRRVCRAEGCPCNHRRRARDEAISLCRSAYAVDDEGVARSVRQPCFPQSPRPPPLLLTRRAGGEQCGRHRSCQSHPPKHVDDATEHIPPLASGQAPILKLRLVGGFPQDSYCLERAADVLREAGTSCPRWE
jgi:hypothetical protein